MKIYLFQQYYIPNNSDRKSEIDFCLKCNLKNKYIDTIYLLNEKQFSFAEMGLTNQQWTAIAETKIVQINIGKRLTYLEAFRTMNGIKIQQDLRDTAFILSNSDMFYNDSLKFLTNYINVSKKQSICLGRYEFHPKIKALRHCNYTSCTRQGMSQDSWIIHSNHLPNTTDPIVSRKLNFQLGKPRCDNRIAFILNEIGLRPINPMKTIRSFHYHSSGYRTYNHTQSIPGSILCVKLQ